MNIELSQIVLNIGVTFLVIITAVFIGVIGYYLVKLLKDVSVLTKNINETSLILNTELKPALQELNEAMRSVNSLIQSTDEGVGNVKSNIENALNKTKEISGNILGGFIKGFMTVFSLVTKAKRR